MDSSQISAYERYLQQQAASKAKPSIPGNSAPTGGGGQSSSGRPSSGSSSNSENVPNNLGKNAYALSRAATDAFTASMGAMTMEQLSYMLSEYAKGNTQPYYEYSVGLWGYTYAAASGAKKFKEHAEGQIWSNWDDYPKTIIDGHEYANIGGRLYSHHAVNRMQPSGMRYSNIGKPNGSVIYQAGGDYGRSVSPVYVEDVINSAWQVPSHGNLTYTLGSVTAVTNYRGNVVTIITR